MSLKRKIAFFLLTLFHIFIANFVCANSSPESALNENNLTPSRSIISEEYKKKSVSFGSAIFLRVYKRSSELELWAQKGPRYHLIKTYSICRWSGELGPKLAEGDKQSPEGLYFIRSTGVFESRRWHRALRLNYPNTFDRLNGRTGSGILIHGKCSSTGCFALNDEQIEEIYEAAEAAFANGQARIPVLSLPFRFTKDALADASQAPPGQFWQDLRKASALFERDRLPPSAWVCEGRYYFWDRRGNAKRKLSFPKGCQPLGVPTSPLDVASPPRPMPEKTPLAAPGESPAAVAEKDAKRCNPHDVRCRMLRVALKSNVACPRKYRRCRTQQAVYTKSVDCPLKYPRCRGFFRIAKAKNTARSVDIRVRRLKR